MIDVNRRLTSLRRLFAFLTVKRIIEILRQLPSGTPYAPNVVTYSLGGAVQGESYGVDSVGRSGCNARAPLLHHILDFYCD